MIAKSKNTDQKHLTDAAQAYLSKELIPLEKEAKVMEAAVFAAISDKSSKLSDATRKHFARILSRAKHCYEPKGGSLSQEQIAECLGLPSSSGSSGVKAIRAMLGDCERAGLLITAGEHQHGKYRLIPSDTKKVEAAS
jgi:hypothetical protein